MMMHFISQRKHFILFVVFAVVIFIAACGRQTYVKSGTYNYLLYIPKGASPDKGFPLLMFLHGSGERGDEPDLVKKWGPPSFLDDTTDFPFMVVSPQCPAEEMWDPAILSAVLDEVITNNNVDITRIYVTGLSIGGHASPCMGVSRITGSGYSSRTF